MRFSLHDGCKPTELDTLNRVLGSPRVCVCVSHVLCNGVWMGLRAPPASTTSSSLAFLEAIVRNLEPPPLLALHTWRRSDERQELGPSPAGRNTGRSCEDAWKFNLRIKKTTTHKPEQRCSSKWDASCARATAPPSSAGGPPGGRCGRFLLHDNSSNVATTELQDRTHLLAATSLSAGAMPPTRCTAEPSPQPGTVPRHSGLRRDRTSTGLNRGVKLCTLRTQCSQTGRFSIRQKVCLGRGNTDNNLTDRLCVLKEVRACCSLYPIDLENPWKFGKVK